MAYGKKRAKKALKKAKEKLRMDKEMEPPKKGAKPRRVKAKGPPGGKRPKAR